LPPVLYTLGYQQRSVDEFTEILRDSNVDVLIDVRETAWSHKPGLTKGSLQGALAANGIEYVHADFAGNPKWLRANADSHRECLDWYAWYLPFLAAGKGVCLTCFERHADD
jgi:uncharacterized protein (DUF488 family)